MHRDIITQLMIQDVHWFSLKILSFLVHYLFVFIKLQKNISFVLFWTLLYCLLFDIPQCFWAPRGAEMWGVRPFCFRRDWTSCGVDTMWYNDTDYGQNFILFEKFATKKPPRHRGPACLYRTLWPISRPGPDVRYASCPRHQIGQYGQYHWQTQ